jgi:hypothetical protein
VELQMSRAVALVLVVLAAGGAGVATSYLLFVRGCEDDPEPPAAGTASSQAVVAHDAAAPARPAVDAAAATTVTPDAPAIATTLDAASTSAEAFDVVYIAAPATTHECAKEPNVAVRGDAITAKFHGKCVKIVVEGNQNRLNIPYSEQLRVTGTGNRVDGKRIDAIKVIGSANEIRYVKGIATDNADISGDLDRNTVTRERHTE